MQYVIAMASRYGALAIQFLLVVLVTSALPQEIAGQYFVSFGLVSTFFCLAGLGLPDGLVRTIGEQLSSEQYSLIKYAVKKTLLYGLLSGLILFSSGGALSVWLGTDVDIAVLTSVWCLLYGLVFVVAQCLVALRHPGLGSFFFYSSTNVCYLFSSIPYLLISEDPQLNILLGLSNTAAFASLLVALIALRQRTRGFESVARASLAPAFRVGAFIAVARLLQSSLFWIPVWIATIYLSTEDAATIGTAGRLLVAVAAVVAALRFSVRPAIIAASAVDDWRLIEVTGRKIALFASGSTICAIAAMLLWGQWAIALLFGPDYSAVWPILIVLLFGALGEAAGGPVDEVLKLTGHGKVILLLLAATVFGEASLAAALSEYGLIGIAVAQAMAFWFMYSIQILYLYSRKGILIIPWHYARR